MKQLFIQRTGLEVMVNAFMKVDGVTREQAVREINTLLKEAEPDAQLIILDEFSVRNVEFKR
jgi:hypothetical protein